MPSSPLNTSNLASSKPFRRRCERELGPHSSGGDARHSGGAESLVNELEQGNLELLWVTQTCRFLSCVPRRSDRELISLFEVQLSKWMVLLSPKVLLHFGTATRGEPEIVEGCISPPLFLFAEGDFLRVTPLASSSVSYALLLKPWE